MSSRLAALSENARALRAAARHCLSLTLLRPINTRAFPRISTNPRKSLLTKFAHDEQIQYPLVRFVNLLGVIEGPARPQDILSTLDRTQFLLVEVDSNSDPPLCRIFSRQSLLDK